ncbi:MerR family transcriptional regulator [Janibacter melonis]|uniref:MerR family transcriptional regulator n=1 Tax=Janibacter melonis TaxID=262209 RepID=UPI002095D601|nr:MerR family transcriptional regulator [Janibacter melonis]
MPLTRPSETGAPLTISGAAHELGITVDTIRYYEKEGSRRPGRGPDGWRRYDADALSWLAGVVMLRGPG